MPILSATQLLNNYQNSDFTAMVKQILDSANFWTVNSHVAPRERDALRRAILRREWPTFPLFSPYAKTKQGYSQVNYKNKKFLIHRVTFRHLKGSHMDDNLEISHTLYCGLRTSSNINPNHMVEETNILNRSRMMCHMWFEHELLETFVLGTGPYPAPETQDKIDGFVGRLVALNNPCLTLHAPLPCNAHYGAWIEDHVVDNPQEVYDAATESEAEAIRRLSEGEDDDGETTVDPNSSFGGGSFGA